MNQRNPMKSTLSTQFSRFFVVTIFIFGVIRLAGCVKKLPPPSEGSNTLLVIPTEVVNKTPIERKYNYIMKFERKPETGRWNDDASETDQKGSRFFSKIVNLKRYGKSLFLVYEIPPGEYRIYSITEEPINVTNAQSITSKLKQIPFIIEEKKIVTYPRKVAYKQELIGASKWFWKKRKLKKMKKEEIIKIREQLKEYKNFELWSFAESL